MTTQHNPQNGGNSADPVDDSDPTGHYHSSAAGRVQQDIADGAEPETPPVEQPDQAPAEPMAPQSPSERFPWMNDTRQWGTRAQLTPHGLTIESIMTGLYGEIPEESREMTRMPRGSFATPGIPRLDNYSVNRKDELWADNAATLYEEAIQRRWNAMQDIAWNDLPDQPEALELAWCQLCTELGHHATAEIDTIGLWLHRMNYAYIEPKMFLATQEFDSARHFEAMRHRALCNGGALGLESAGFMNRRMVETRAGWPEVSVSLYIARGTLSLLLYRFGTHFAANPVDRKLFALCLQDKARHMAYGMVIAQVNRCGQGRGLRRFFAAHSRLHRKGYGRRAERSGPLGSHGHHRRRLHRQDGKWNGGGGTSALRLCPAIPDAAALRRDKQTRECPAPGSRRAFAVKRRPLAPGLKALALVSCQRRGLLSLPSPGSAG